MLEGWPAMAPDGGKAAAPPAGPRAVGHRRALEERQPNSEHTNVAGECWKSLGESASIAAVNRAMRNLKTARSFPRYDNVTGRPSRKVVQSVGRAASCTQWAITSRMAANAWW